MIDTTGRHPGTEHLARYVRSEHLADGKARSVAEQRHAFPRAMNDALQDGPELTAELLCVLQA